MKPKAFWIYTFFGLLPALVVLGVYGLFLRSPTPEYEAHVKETSRIAAWYAERGLNREQLLFDEALANLSDGSDPSDSADRALIGRLRQLVHGDKPSDRAKAIGGLLLDKDGRPASFRLIGCPEDRDKGTVFSGCWFERKYASLGNPERLAILLSGDAEAIRSVLPAIPADIRSVPAWHSDASKYRGYPAWTDRFGERGRLVVVWALLSVVFVFGFALAGAIFSDDDEWGRPIAGWPHFALGWIVMAAAAPGFLLFKTLRFLAMDLQPGWKRLVRTIKPRNFKSDHERVIATLTELRDRAADRGNSEETVGFIDSTLAKVREVSDHEELEKLRKVAEDIRIAYEARLEIEQALS